MLRRLCHGLSCGLVSVLLLPGCKEDEPTYTPLVCPREPTGAVPAGDANGDGTVDLSDAVVILRSVADGGPAPACTAAVDLIPNERVDLDDAFSLLTYLYEGAFSLPSRARCPDATPHTPPNCSRIDVRVSDGGAVELLADTASIEAWSLGVRVEGCTLTAVTTAGTRAASIVDDPPGLRDFGYDATFLTDEGAASAVVLGFMGSIALPSGSWSPVLQLDLQKGNTCTCTVRLDQSVTALGQPVESLVVVGGGALLVPKQFSLDLCG